MNTNDCKTIRREIDEADTNQQLSTRTTEHLRGCSACSAFASDRHALRGLIGTLQPLAAPPDFDFRLRARLAREKSNAQNGAGLSSLFKISKPVAAAALVLLFIVVGVVVKNRMASSPGDTAQLPATKVVVPEPAHPQIVPTVPAKSDPGSVATTSGTGNNPTADGPHDGLPRKIRAPRTNPIAGPREETKTREFAVSPASVIVGEQAENAGSVVRVPLDTRALQISIDDGRGVAHTILLPRVSFGSQRLVAIQSFMPPVSTTKGVWEF